MITRRAFLTSLGFGFAGTAGVSSYAVGVEPRYRLDVTSYRLTPPGWPSAGKPLRIAALADIHACDPWMPVWRIEEIVAQANALQPDLIVLLGDYVAGMTRFVTRKVPPADWARALGGLKAPLGVHAVLGNHDWWTYPEKARAALENNGIPVLENDAVRLAPAGGSPFWLLGLGDQWAHPLGRNRFRGVDDLPGTLAKVPDDGAPLLLLAHEPDIFPKVPARVGLTLSGHTHGGQIALPLVGRPVVPSRYGERFAYGHVIENGRHLIVSGGIGCSIAPVRLGVPPEIVFIELGGGPTA